MSWGAFWGAFWGGGAPLSPVSVAQATAVSERQVQVALTAPPQAQSAIAEGDALNPATWIVINDDTGENCMVIGARMVGPQLVELYCLQLFGPATDVMQVSCPTLRSTSGAPGLAPLEADFLGCVFVPPAEVPGGLVDIANPYFPATGVPGTITVRKGGDYRTESGADLLKKLVIRRLSTMAGDFAFLDPSYGAGIQLKAVLRGGDLARLKKRILLNLAQEPELQNVSVLLTLDPSGALTIEVNATLSTTQAQVSTTVPVLPPQAAQ